MATPLFIEIGLHYRTRAGEFDPSRFQAPAVQDALSSFVEHGLLEKLDAPDKWGATYQPTEGLYVWCDALCSVKFPVQKWVLEPPPQEQR